MREREVFSWPQINITRESYSEVLGDHNPLAVEIASPLFDIGVRQTAITERIHYHIQKDHRIGKRVYHIFNLVLQGELYVQVGDERKLLRPGEIAFSPAGSPYLLQGKPHGRVRFLYVEVFDTPYWAPLKEGGPFMREYEHADQLFLLLRRALDSHKSRKDIPLARANAQCIVELLKLERSRVQVPRNRHKMAIQELADAIRIEPSRDWNTSEMAKELSISRATLTRHFLQEFGHPPKEMVIRQRIARATELLDGTQESIEVISREVGYESPFTFSNIFKKYTGLRPSQYRDRSF